MGVDIAVTQDTRGNFDINIDPLTGDFKIIDGFDTALPMSLFCERRAASSEVSTPQLRRGWWGNLVRDDSFEIGSKLWLLDQTRNTQSTLNRAVDYAKKSLQWLVDDNHIISFEVSAIFITDGVKLTIILNRSNSATETRSFELWQSMEKIDAV